jgi:hypothetical protein
MNEPNWDTVADKKVAAPKDFIWVLVVDYIRGPRKLKFEATGSWTYEAGVTCGPDGAPREGFHNSNLHKSALRGCLLAKIGGSPGDTPGSDKIWAVGSYSVIEISDQVSGGLFVSMNDDPRRFPLHDGEIQVKISEASSAP